MNLQATYDSNSKPLECKYAKKSYPSSAEKAREAAIGITGFLSFFCFKMNSS